MNKWMIVFVDNNEKDGWIQTLVKNVNHRHNYHRHVEFNSALSFVSGIGKETRL